jgi:6-phosphogluconolactonase
VTNGDPIPFILAVSHPGSGDIRTYRPSADMTGLDHLQTVALSGDPEASTTSVPMVLLRRRQVLLAGLRGAPYPVVALRVDPATGELTRIGEGRLPGGPPYLSADAEERFLLGAINPGAAAFVEEIGPDSVPKPDPVAFVDGMPKAHCIVSLGRTVYLASCDQPAIFQFTLGPAGQLTPHAVPQVAGTGKDDFRHLAISPDSKSLYAISEARGSVVHFTIDPKNGGLTHRASLLLSDEVCEAADIAIANDGRHLYTSERRRSTLSTIALGPDGSPGATATIPTEATPRAMAMAPDGRHLFVAGEKSDAVATYALDPDSGAPTLLGRTTVGSRPNWITVIPITG